MKLATTLTPATAFATLISALPINTHASNTTTIASSAKEPWPWSPTCYGGLSLSAQGISLLPSAFESLCWAKLAA